MESVVTEYKDMCIFCGNAAEAEHHLVFGNGRRQIAEDDGLKVPMCHRCHNVGPLECRIHNNIAAEKLSKMLGQAVYEKECYRKLYEATTGDKSDKAREYFRGRYGKSYL